MKDYKVNYREKNNTKGEVFETITSADNIREVREHSKIDLKDYTVIKIELVK